MPITGQESALEALLISTIKAGIAARCGAMPLTPNCIDGLCKGIADAIIPFLVANMQVNPGQVVTGTTSPTVPGSPAAVIAASSAPGTIS